MSRAQTNHCRWPSQAKPVSNILDQSQVDEIINQAVAKALEKFQGCMSIRGDSGLSSVSTSNGQVLGVDVAIVPVVYALESTLR